MKTKNYWHLLTIMMVAMLSFGFVSCGDSDDEGGGAGSELLNDLQGTWEFYKGTEKIMGMTITVTREQMDEMKSMLEQSSGMRISIWDETLDFNGSYVNGEKFSLKGKNIIFDGMELFDGFTITVKKVNSSVLVLQEKFDMEGMSFTADMEYHKQ